MINNEGSTIPIPEEITKAIEVARNNLTLLQAETTRVSKLKLQIEKEIVVLGGTKKNLEDNIISSQSQLDKISVDYKSTSEQLETAQKSLENIKVEQTTIQGDINAQKADLSVKIAKLESDITTLQLQNASLEESIKNHKKEVDAFELKKIILADTIKKL